MRRNPRRRLIGRGVPLLMLALSGVLVACTPGSPSRATPASKDAVPTSAASAPAATGPAVGFRVGQRAPAFSVTTLDGAPLSSADLQAQQRPFILYAFATW